MNLHQRLQEERRKFAEIKRATPQSRRASIEEVSDDQRYRAAYRAHQGYSPSLPDDSAESSNNGFSAVTSYRVSRANSSAGFPAHDPGFAEAVCREGAQNGALALDASWEEGRIGGDSGSYGNVENVSQQRGPVLGVESGRTPFRVAGRSVGRGGAAAAVEKGEQGPPRAAPPTPVPPPPPGPPPSAASAAAARAGLPGPPPTPPFNGGGARERGGAFPLRPPPSPGEEGGAPPPPPPPQWGGGSGGGGVLARLRAAAGELAAAEGMLAAQERELLDTRKENLGLKQALEECLQEEERQQLEREKSMGSSRQAESLQKELEDLRKELVREKALRNEETKKLDLELQSAMRMLLDLEKERNQLKQQVHDLQTIHYTTKTEQVNHQNQPSKSPEPDGGLPFDRQQKGAAGEAPAPGRSAPAGAGAGGQEQGAAGGRRAEEEAEAVPWMILEVDLGGGVSGQLEIFQDTRPEVVAAAFISAHGLEDDLLGPLTTYVRESMQTERAIKQKSNPNMYEQNVATNSGMHTPFYGHAGEASFQRR